MKLVLTVKVLGMLIDRFFKGFGVGVCCNFLILEIGGLRH